MPHLSVRVLGPFQASLDGEPLSGLNSDKVRALLAYLVLLPDQPCRRESLAGLLWPEFPERSARTNLRNALANLRHVLGEHARSRDRDALSPLLLSTHQTIQFNGQSDYWLDAAAFEALVATVRPTREALEQAVSLVRGSFLEGFSLADAASFEEWLLLHREHVCRQVVGALDSLAAIYERQGAFEQALAHARRRVELEPWEEDGQRQLMRLLARSGHRSQALAQYEDIRRSFRDELGAQPAKETTKLYQKIRNGELEDAVLFPLSPPDLVAESPAFLDEEWVEVESPVFVARERELAQLDRFLGLALTGQGRVVFVTGEAGSGKTTLVQEFTRYAQDAHADLIAAGGNCNAYAGVGDPYLPFRKILELLTGNVEAKWEAGALTSEQARRLWHTLPTAVRALLDAGPDLIDTFVPGAALLEFVTTYAQWPGSMEGPTRLNHSMERKLVARIQDMAPDAGVSGSPQSQLFEQFTKVLETLARRAPLVLVMDDLQWADAGSINLLFHLGRQLAGSRILILGAYRPEDVALGRDGERHPLEPVVNEFQREFGDVAVNLDRAERRDFVEAFLDSPASALAPNRLGVAFRESLYRQTRGHPLFTVELLRGLQERGDLVQDSEGHWVEGPSLVWETLPARVEAVIAERIGRLARPLQDILRVASVEGEVFTAEVVASVRAADAKELVDHLSGELDRRHRLVRAQGILRREPTRSGAQGSQRLSHYRFRHILFQRYLYNNLDTVERAHLHEAVGNTLETLFKDQIEARADIGAAGAVAGQLAWHFKEAGIAEKAIHYLHQAGERAVLLSAYEEGIAHLTQGLALLMALPDPGAKDQRQERSRQELALQLALGIAWIGKTYGSEMEQAFARARDLCQRLGETSQLCLVLDRLSSLHHMRSEHQKARELAEEALSLAQGAEDPLHVALGHRQLGHILCCLGEYATARAHFEHMISFYEPQHHHRSLVSLRGSDAGASALAHDACCLWCLGFPEQALKRSQEALALARELGHPFSLAGVLGYAGIGFYEMCRDAPALKVHAEELLRVVHEKVPGWLGAGTHALGVALVMLGQVQEGMAQLREGMAALQSRRYLCDLPTRLYFLAEAQAKSGHPEEGLSTIAEALVLVEETGERCYEAELNRLRAEILQVQGDEAGAEASLLKAIEVARRQQARSWELRAATSLARLWQKQGRRREARKLLAPIYGWFTEGFDTRDLKDARALLDELS